MKNKRIPAMFLVVVMVLVTFLATTAQATTITIDDDHTETRTLDADTILTVYGTCTGTSITLPTGGNVTINGSGTLILSYGFYNSCNLTITEDVTVIAPYINYHPTQGGVDAPEVYTTTIDGNAVVEATYIAYTAGERYDGGSTGGNGGDIGAVTIGGNAYVTADSIAASIADDIDRSGVAYGGDGGDISDIIIQDNAVVICSGYIGYSAGEEGDSENNDAYGGDGGTVGDVYISDNATVSALAIAMSEGGYADGKDYAKAGAGGKVGTVYITDNAYVSCTDASSSAIGLSQSGKGYTWNSSYAYSSGASKVGSVYVLNEAIVENVRYMGCSLGDLGYWKNGGYSYNGETGGVVGDVHLAANATLYDVPSDVAFSTRYSATWDFTTSHMSPGTVSAWGESTGNLLYFGGIGFEEGMELSFIPTTGGETVTITLRDDLSTILQSLPAYTSYQITYSTGSSGGYLQNKSGGSTVFFPTSTEEMSQAGLPTYYEVAMVQSAAPTITSHPQSTSVSLGGTATFSVSVVAGSTPVSYQWYDNTTGANNGTGTLIGTSATLQVPNITDDMDGRYYYCQVTDGTYTLYSNVAQLTVSYAPTAATTTQSPSTGVLPGSFITFTATVTGHGSPASYSYQWFVDGNLVSGATNSTYTRTISASDHEKEVYCIISNTAGSIQPSAVTMSVYSLPSVTDPTSLAVNEGSNATFQVSVTGGYPSDYTYQWYVNGSAISGATNSSYTRTATASDHGTTLYCIVSSLIGSTTSGSATLNVYSAPTVSAPSSVTVNAGSSATFQVIASGGYPSNYTYQWYVGGTPVSGATSSTLSYSATAEDNGAFVYCLVSNGQYNVSSGMANLTVQYAPSAAISATTTSVAVGDSISFSATITSPGNPNTYTYQWYAGGEAVSGANSNGYTRTATTQDDGKEVYCTVSNAAGATNTDQVVISVYEGVTEASLIAAVTDISGSILGTALYMDGNQIVYPYSTDGLGVSFDTIPVTGYYVTAYAELLGQTYLVYFSNEEEHNVLQTKYPSQGQFYIDPSTLPTTTRTTPLTIYVTMYSDESLTQVSKSDAFTMYLSVDTVPPVVSFQNNAYTQACLVSVRDVVAGVSSISYSVVSADGSIASSGTSATSDFTLSLEPGDVVTVTATDKVGNQSTITSSSFVAGTGGVLLPESLIPTDIDVSIYYYKTTLFDCYLIGGKYNNVD